MDCTLNILGYRSCGNTFRYYLDDYGISLNSASKVADDKFVNAKDMLDKLISQSWTETFADITFDGMDANKILNDVTVTDMDYSDSFTGTKTVSFELDDECELGSFYLSQLNVYVKESGVTTIQLIQGTTVSELYYDTPDDNSVIELAINDFVNNEFSIKVITEGVVWLGTDNSECRCEGVQWYTITKNDNVLPFVLTFQVRCNKLVHLCKYVDLIAPIVIYKVLGKFWFKVHTTDIFSNYVNSEAGKAIEMMVYYDSDYRSIVVSEVTNKALGQYQIALNKLNIPKPTCKCCMQCRTSGWTYQGMKP